MQNPLPAVNTEAKSRQGVIYALLAYGSWGLFPLYWKQFGSVPAAEVICHRLLWSLVFLVILAAAWKQLAPCLRVIRSPRLVGLLFLTAALLSFNWGLFVYGVNTGQVVETSLGYFINPLVNVLLGAVVLRERLTRAQIIAVLLATVGVIYFGWHLWKVPWIALGIASSFGIYGLLRKMVPIDPLPGLLVETAVMAPVALILLGIFAGHGSMHFLDTPKITLLLMGGGIVTAFPLIWFISAAKLLPLSTLGFFQYLAPTLQLLVGVFVFHERFTLRDGIAFAFIWTAIALFMASSRFRARKEPVIEPAA
ncbi:chloramphenicol-sensitive protein RarD [Terrimicrobium sacchariphilum]|uniref:Chloramphenicol-sensitive protein RarD n=1 Tax=Terrimicrobium sacchariphilum TaxID=690879 RepID=A0A146G7V1_TERSA|nr:chloramphenicol-sensitive protein RarD [Terrimicrobium sacchariphilum]